MRIIGMMLARNEEWCLGLSARVALDWCDALVILDHSSVDGTGQIIADLVTEYGVERVFPLASHHDETWNEMVDRQAMLMEARFRGATHCAIIDADEVLTSYSREWVRLNIAALQDWEILQLPLWNLRGGIDRYHADGIWGKRSVSVAFKDRPDRGWSGDRFHSREPGASMEANRPSPLTGSGVMHLWGASERRLVAKHALYKVIERIRWPEKPIHKIEQMYNWAIKGEPGTSLGSPETWSYRQVTKGWWDAYEQRGWMKYLNIDAEPWQEEEVRRLVKLHGRDKFTGLDLFGVV